MFENVCKFMKMCENVTNCLKMFGIVTKKTITISNMYETYENH